MLRHVVTVLLAVSAPLAAAGGDLDNLLEPTSGRAWFVHPQGANGNDGTRQAPLKNVDAALKKAAGGDTILVAAGTYSGTFGIGYLETDKAVKLYGSFNDDFSARSVSRHPTVFAPDNASGAKSRKAMLSFTRAVDGAVVDGFVLDAGERNAYSSSKGKPPGVATGRLLLPPQKEGSQVATVTEPLLRVPSAAAGGDMVIRNNVFLNGASFAIQAGVRSGTLTVENNVFVANRMAAIEVYGTCAGGAGGKGSPCGTARIRDNTILFTWSRLEDLADMGYGVRVMTKLAYEISHNLIGGNVLGGVDHTRFNPDQWIRLEGNQFFVNRRSDLWYSPASNTSLEVRVEDFGDLSFASVQGNRAGIPSSLPVNTAYLEGFLAVTYSEETSLDRGSPANQWRSILGMPLEGTMKSETSMFANRYPREDALRLIGAVPGVGAR